MNPLASPYGPRLLKLIGPIEDDRWILLGEGIHKNPPYGASLVLVVDKQHTVTHFQASTRSAE